MKKHILFFVVLLISAATVLWAAEVQLIYKDGEVSVKEADSWAPLTIGETLSMDSEVRLPPGAIAEFSGPSTSLFFSKAGTYRLKALAEAKPEKEITLYSSVFNRFTEMGGESDRDLSQAMGVRGDDATGDGGITWVEEDSMNFDEAVSAYRRGKFSTAVDILENRVDPIVLSDESEYWYYLSAAYLKGGNTGPALKIARHHQANEFSRVYSDFLLLKGRLLLEAMDYNGAAEKLQKYIYSAETDRHKQIGYYLYGIALQQQGRIEQARKSLQMALQLDAEAEITNLARQRHTEVQTPPSPDN